MSSTERFTLELPHAARRVADVVALLGLCAGRPDPGTDADPITILDHGLQCAALLRCAMPDDLELQVAGLVHDVGHALVPDDDEGHARHAAAFVRPVLGHSVAALIAMHVPAKRWLVTVDPQYGRRLSPSSRRALTHQGGVMSGPERDVFEASPFRRRAVALRRADEAGRSPGLRVPGLDRWMDPIDRLARANRHAA